VVRVGFTAVFAPYLYFVLRSYDYYARGDQFILDKTTNWRVWGFSILCIVPIYVDMQYCCRGNSLFKTVSDEASIKRGRPKLATSFILGQTCDVACWHEPDIARWPT
jgi:hypothetical protein